MDQPQAYDDIVIGTGQAGRPLAVALAQAGRRTAIVERRRVGGTCIIDGCTPSKTMTASARVAHLARRAGDYGIEVGEVTVDMEAVRKRKREIVDSWSSGSRKQLEEQDSLDLIRGEAVFTGSHELRVTLSDGGERTLEGERIFVNTGARPRIPHIPGLDGVDVLDSTSIMELGEVPDHLLVLGGGFVGLEFAQMFRRFGARVSILEQGPHLAPREDEDVCQALEGILSEDGIVFHLGAEVRKVSPGDDGGIRVHFRTEGNSTETVHGSHLLVAVGRVPNTDALAPDAAGLELDDGGSIRVNDRLETNVPGIWALGDVNGGPPFTHVAYDDFRIVRENLLGKGGASREGRILPYVVFIDPQLGRVGLDEGGARREGLAFRVARLPMDRAARALEMDESRGFMKAVVEEGTDRILGATVFGVEGGELLAVLQMAMMGGVPWTEIRDGVFAHPTLAESLNNLFMSLDG